MPTYEFRCPDGHTFERFYRSISGGEAEVPCPECGKTATRLMSPTGFAFKGSGFYLTDYGKNAHRGGDSPAEKAKKTAESTSGAESKSSDSKSSDSKSSDSKGSDAKPAAEAKADSPSKSTKSDGGSAPAAPSAPSPKSDK
jgi:putative FmdB family regulatory protein